MRRSRRAAVRGIARAYGKLTSGVPALVWLMVLYYVVFASVDIPAVAVSIICFGLLSAASLAEVFLTGLEGVDKGQVEAALAMGFSRGEAFRRIVLPQAAKNVWPLYSAELGELIKATSVVGYIAIQDLTKASDIIRSRTFQAFFPLFATAIVYFAVIALCAAVLALIGRRMDPRRRKPEAVLKGIER
jgi:polar amino acid transport system substrate-binding protein